jgi:hypothetical protein
MGAAVLRKTKKWLEEIVIGLNFCPFAKAPFVEGKIRFAVCRAGNADDAIEFALSEAMKILDVDEEEIATTLLIYPLALADFGEYLQALATLESILEEAGAAGLLQIASFHPDYLFSDEVKSSLSHYTNRSPYPIFHILRESQVQFAVDSHSDTSAIPLVNIERLQAMGHEEVAKRWKEPLDR